MKQLHERYAELVRTGPSGLFSASDLERIALHAEDGCAGAAHVASLGPSSVIDIGSGGGVPGIQLAIELPDATVTLVESQGWKADFLRTCARALDLESRVSVHAQRAEALPAQLGREGFDVGTARALAAPIVVAEYLAPLVRVGGQLVLWASREQATLPGVGPVPSLGLAEPTIVEAPSRLRSAGILITWPKAAACDARFPRRVGVAAKRPLAR